MKVRLGRSHGSHDAPRSRVRQLACELIREAIARREALELQRKLARDYAADRGDAKQILQDLEVAQLELLDREDA